MRKLQRCEVPVAGMDCAECTRHVQRAIAALPGVESVDVFLTTEKAVVQLDPKLVDLPAIQQAVEGAGYSVPATTADPSNSSSFSHFTRRVGTLLALVFGAVLFIAIVGEWLGLFEELTALVPFPLGLAIVLISGWSIFRNVVRAALKRQVTSHTLMTMGVLAALIIGEWVTAAVVVFFMRVGDYVESFTAERARRAVKDLTALAPQMARVERDGLEQEVPIGEVVVGEVVIVRPGEKIPVDGEVISGQATVDQAAITGESMPVEVEPGMHVFAATMAQLGRLRVRTGRVGADTTFGRVVKMVEEAEAHRAGVQRFADKFSGYYLPIVASLAALTFIFRRDPLATAAVLVVACSCSIALATPIAMLASIGAGAKRGLMVKGGKYLEALAQADTLLLDKTGTLTLGKPQLTDVISLNGLPDGELLTLAASAERYSEHPLAEAVRAAAHERKLPLFEPEGFEALPGLGVRAAVNEKTVTIGNQRLVATAAAFPLGTEPFDQLRAGPFDQLRAGLEAQGKTLLFIALDGELAGILAAADTQRAEVPAALAEVRKLGIQHIELLTGDNERVAAALAEGLKVGYRANLLPEDKIEIVKAYQAQGHTVVMVGDGVNDAPALAQANVGIAMGVVGTDVAIETAHIALMREDWTLVPEVFRIAQRTMGVVKMNLIFTGIYNLVGLGLAAFGFLPPILAAAAQSLPDLGILANSSRLLQHRAHLKYPTHD